jgi:hypothetical protein
MGFMPEEASILEAAEGTSPGHIPSDTAGFRTLATMACPVATTADSMEAIGVILTLDSGGGSVSRSAGRHIPFGRHIPIGTAMALGWFLLPTTATMIHAIIAISAHEMTTNAATAQVVLPRHPTPFLACPQPGPQERDPSHTRESNRLIPIPRTSAIK